MFCIAAFIVFAILAIFSATFRPLAGKAWHCVIRRVSFRPCDIDFSEELKGKIIGRALRHSPALARFISRWIDWFATIFVVLSIWSLIYVATSGLYIFVYGTCNPSNVESCTLSGEACGVNQVQLSFVSAVKEGKLANWAAGPFVRVFDALIRVPDRLRTWESTKYLAPHATYLKPFDPAKPTALEIIDPGCRFCQKLTGNIESSGLPDRYNVSYLLYPIPVSEKYKFPNSLLMASWLEATKQVPLNKNPSGTPPDWQLLKRIFADTGTDIDLQTRFNVGFTKAEAETELKNLLKNIGYTDAQIQEIAKKAASSEIASEIEQERKIVENEVRTIKIPTLLIGGRRYDQVVSIETLRSYAGNKQ